MKYAGVKVHKEVSVTETVQWMSVCRIAVHQITVTLNYTSATVLHIASCQQELGSGASQQVCRHKCAKELGLGKVLMGCHEAYNIVLAT